MIDAFKVDNNKINMNDLQKNICNINDLVRCRISRAFTIINSHSNYIIMSIKKDINFLKPQTIASCRRLPC